MLIKCDAIITISNICILQRLLAVRQTRLEEVGGSQQRVLGKVGGAQQELLEQPPGTTLRPIHGARQMDRSHRLLCARILGRIVHQPKVPPAISEPQRSMGGHESRY